MKYTASILGFAAVASAQQFTSIYNITATPNQVVNSSSLPAPGQPGATGQFNYAIDSRTNTICYDITLFGVSGTYQSPANTATHIHEAAVGRNGPPRIAFPNPVGNDVVRRSAGCLTGPFTTGLKMADNVTDTGAGFNVAQIEANPAGFFTDSHTNLFVPGVVRGQMNQNFKLVVDGAAVTTATLVATKVITITSCAPTVTACPYSTAPLTTTTLSVYTTVCPVSQLPNYSTVVVQISDGQIQATAKATGVLVSQSEHATVASAKTTAVVYPTTVVYPAGSQTTTVVAVTKTSAASVASGTTPAAATTTSRVVQYTGAANVNAVGGGVFAAGLMVAALL